MLSLLLTLALALPDPYTTTTSVYADVDAAIATAPDGTDVDLQALIDAGGPVTFPAGVYRIDQELSIPAGTVVTGAADFGTVLYRNPTTYADWGALASVAGTAAGTEISNIAFVGNRGSGTANADKNDGILLTETQDFRIHDCYFASMGFAGVDARSIGGEHHPTGVVDNCLFHANYKVGINVGYGVVVYGTGDADWEQGPEFGGGEAVFVEDCVFTLNRHAAAANNGAHYVFRRNHVYDHRRSHMIDVHGGSYGSDRGSRCVECYENTFDGPILTDTGGTFHTGFLGVRGGAGAVWGNTATGFARCGVRLIIQTPDQADYKAQGYPAQDQVQDLHVWGNTISGGAPDEPGFTLGVDHIESHFFRLNRDYFIRPPCNYSPYAYPHPLRGEIPEPFTVPTGPAPITPAAYTATIAANAGGSVYPSTISVGAGEVVNVVPMADAGKVVQTLLVDGVGASDFGSFRLDGLGWKEVSNFCFWTEKPGDRTLLYKFKTAPTNNRTITASAGAGGAIYPSGATQITNARDQGYVIVPDDGFHVADVLVDSVSVGPTGFYEFAFQTSDATIQAVFEAD